jgi:hypothetical protein
MKGAIREAIRRNEWRCTPVAFPPANFSSRHMLSDLMVEAIRGHHQRSSSEVIIELRSRSVT